MTKADVTKTIEAVVNTIITSSENEVTNFEVIRRTPDTMKAIVTYHSVDNLDSPSDTGLITLTYDALNDTIDAQFTYYGVSAETRLTLDEIDPTFKTKAHKFYQSSNDEWSVHVDKTYIETACDYTFYRNGLDKRVVQVFTFEKQSNSHITCYLQASDGDIYSCDICRNDSDNCVDIMLFSASDEISTRYEHWTDDTYTCCVTTKYIESWDYACKNLIDAIILMRQYRDKLDDDLTFKFNVINDSTNHCDYSETIEMKHLL